MNAREIEQALVSRCVVVARDVLPVAQDDREANVFQLAATLVQSTFPIEAKRLCLASEKYFAQYPNVRLATSDIVKKRWVQSLPRLRDMLNQKLHEE